MALNVLDSETFSGTADPLGGSWVEGDGTGFQKDSGEVGASPTDDDCSTYWDATARNYSDPQWSEITLNDVAASGAGIGAAVFCDGADYLEAQFGATASAAVWSLISSSWTEEGSTGDVVGSLGDVLRLEIDNGTWKYFLNDSQQDTASGFTGLTDGQPGIYGIRSDIGDADVSAWRAGDFAAGGGRIMSSLANKGGLAGIGGIAGDGGGLAG